MAKIQRPSSDLCSAPWPDFRHLLILDIIILDSIYSILVILYIYILCIIDYGLCVLNTICYILYRFV